MPLPDKPPPEEQSHGPVTQQAASPRDVFITVYGDKPVLEALIDPALTIDKVIVAEQARGGTVQEILDAVAGRCRASSRSRSPARLRWCAPSEPAGATT